MDVNVDADERAGLVALSQKRSVRFVCLLLLATITYIPAMQAGFVWDDDSYITHSRNDRTLLDLWRIWVDPDSVPQYYPLLHTSFWLEYQLWGVVPIGYHVVNIMWNGLAAGLAWLVLERLRLRGAWLAAAIFAVHPVHVETVAWATERKNVMSAALALTALLVFMNFYGIDRNEFGRDPQRNELPLGKLRWGWYPWGLLLFAAALFSKTVVATLPIVIVLLLWWKRRRLDRRTIGPLLPLFALGAALGSVTSYLEKYKVGAIGQDWDFGLIERGLIAGRALWFYVGKLFWPHPLVFIYPRWKIDPHMPEQYVWPIAAVAVVMGLAILARRIGRGPLVAALVFIAGLSPALGFFDVYPMRFSFVADHFVYLASLSVIASGVVAAAIVLSVAGPARRPIGATVATILLLTLSVITWSRCKVFQDAETLWQDTLGKNEGCMIACFNMAFLRYEESRFDDARTYIEQAWASQPDHPLTHKHLAWIQEAQGQIDQAIESLHRSISLYQGDEPERGVAHLTLADLLAERGERQSAIEEYRHAIRCRQWDTLAREGLGQCLVELGQIDQALNVYEDLRETDPLHTPSHYNLGLVYQRLGRVNEAFASYEQAIHLDPDHALAHNNLGMLLATIGRPQEAVPHFEAALKVRPHDVSTHVNMALAMASLGRHDQTLSHVEQALAIEPDHVGALRIQARLLATEPTGNENAPQRQRAIEIAKRACALTRQRDPICLDTLAFAYAKAHRFKEAVEVSTHAWQLAKDQGKLALAHQIDQRRRAYASEK